MLKSYGNQEIKGVFEVKGTQEIKIKSDELAMQLTRSAVVAAAETQIVRRRFEETFGNSDLNHMANWISEILKAFYIFESVDKAVGETMTALDEIKKYMTPKESEAFFESVTMSRGWILPIRAVKAPCFSYGDETAQFRPAIWSS